MKTRSLIFLFSIAISYTFPLKAQPSIEWQKCFGGSGYEKSRAIRQTTDGGYIAAGYSDSNDGDVSGNHGSSDMWIVRLDAPGNLMWQKSYGGTYLDMAQDIQQISDGGFIVAGIALSDDGDFTGHHGLTSTSDYMVMRLDSNGNIVWQKSLGGTDEDEAEAVQQTADGGFIVAGWSWSSDGDVSVNQGSHDYWIVKLDANGNLEWQKSMGGGNDDEAWSIQESSDGGYIVAGMSKSQDGDVSGLHGYFFWDYWIVKLDIDGDIVWEKCLGGSDIEWAYSILQTIDGGFIVEGSSESNDGDISGNHGHSDYWTVKLDAVGNIAWQKSMGGSDDDMPREIQQTSDGGFIVAGMSKSNDGDVTGNHGSHDYWIVKLNTYGNLVWQKSLGGSGIEQGWAIQQTTDGGFITSGVSTSNDGDVSGYHGGDDSWIVKLSCDQSQIFYADTDNDGFGNVNDTLQNCTIPAGYVANSSDCNDANSAIHPGAIEIPGNGIDEDCDGIVDECEANFTLYPDSLIPHHYWIVNLATGIPPLNYYWSWGDSSYDSIAYPSHTYAAAGFYTICLTIQDSTGCTSNYCNSYNIQKMSSAEAENTIVTVDVVDSLPGVSINIQDIHVLQAWSVFPNPASGNVFVNYSLSTAAAVSIEVYDVLGKKLRQTVDDQQTGDYHSTINIQELPEGIYFLQIRAGDQMASQKLIVSY